MLQTGCYLEVHAWLETTPAITAVLALHRADDYTDSGSSNLMSIMSIMSIIKLFRSLMCHRTEANSM